MIFPFPWNNKNKNSVITITEFLNNPSGSSSSYGGRRLDIKTNLSIRYTKLLSRTQNKLPYVCYKDVDKYYFIFKIPSETFDNLLYDVVLEFYPLDDNMKKETSLINYGMKFFSNSPHMMFTYTYVLNKQGLLIDFIKQYRCSKTALNNSPSVTNPVEQFGFEKTCYFAALYLKSKKHLVKGNIENLVDADISSKVTILNSISGQEEKLAEYNKLKANKISSRKLKQETKKKKSEHVINDIAYKYKGRTNNKKKK